MLNDFAQYNASAVKKKKITQQKIYSDLIKRVGIGEITTLLIHLQNHPNRLQVKALNKVLPCYLLHDSSKEYEKAKTGAWTLLIFTF